MLSPTTIVPTRTVSLSKRSATTSDCPDGKCSMPEDSTHKTAVKVGVGVAVPVGCVLLFFLVVLILVRRKSKKEDREEAAEIEYGQTYAKRYNSGPDNENIKDNRYYKPAYMRKDVTRGFPNKQAKFYKVRHTPPNEKQFYAPENAYSREDNGRLHSYSKNNSSQAELSNRIPHQYNNSRMSLNSPQNVITDTDRDLSRSTISNEKKDRNPTYSTVFSSNIDSFDFESQNEKPTNRDTKHIEDNDKKMSNVDEEGINRMHSIYNAYSNFDSNNPFLKDAKVQDDMEKQGLPVDSSIPEQGNHARDESTIRYTMADDLLPTSVPKEDTNSIEKETPIVKETADVETIIENFDTKKDKSQYLSVGPITQRHASSVYSEIPSQLMTFAAYQQNVDQQTQLQQYTPEQMEQMQLQMEQMQMQQYQAQMQMEQQMQMQYQMQQQQMQSNQYYHPQTLENIAELPTPTQLVASPSTHSLTSFKRKNKQGPLQAYRVNGTALNPMDHPEMFYNQSYDQAQYQNQQVTNNGALMPHQMRQSIVMTNPSSLSQSNRYKPAGSLRNISNPNSVNSGNNLQVPTMNNSRVSGLLNAEDTLQPPSVGQILPHSGSSEDLRRQLGVSDNYAQANFQNY